MRQKNHHKWWAAAIRESNCVEPVVSRRQDLGPTRWRVVTFHRDARERGSIGLWRIQNRRLRSDLTDCLDTTQTQTYSTAEERITAWSLKKKTIENLNPSYDIKQAQLYNYNNYIILWYWYYIIDYIYIYLQLSLVQISEDTVAAAEPLIEEAENLGAQLRLQFVHADLLHQSLHIYSKKNRENMAQGNAAPNGRGAAAQMDLNDLGITIA